MNICRLYGQLSNWDLNMYEICNRASATPAPRFYSQIITTGVIFNSLTHHSLQTNNFLTKWGPEVCNAVKWEMGTNIHKSKGRQLSTRRLAPVRHMKPYDYASEFTSSRYAIFAATSPESESKHWSYGSVCCITQLRPSKSDTATPTLTRGWDESAWLSQ